MIGFRQLGRHQPKAATYSTSGVATIFELVDRLASRSVRVPRWIDADAFTYAFRVFCRFSDREQRDLVSGNFNGSTVSKRHHCPKIRLFICCNSYLFMRCK